MKLLQMFICLLILLFGSAGSHNANGQELKITKARLLFPKPAFPFYHFKVKLELPHSSIIQVKAIVNGDTLRFTNLYSSNLFQKIDMNKPLIAYRPPSGYALSVDTSMYKNPYVIGRLRWEPGRHYTIKVIVTMKKGAQKTTSDVVLSASKTLKAPKNAPFFDTSWKNYMSVIVSETVGVDRKNEPVEVLLSFYPDQAENIKNDIRVVAVDPRTHKLSLVPSQLYDIRKFLKKDNLEPLKKGGNKRKVPLWYPTITARLTFLASVPANSSRVFLIFYNNKYAKKKIYRTNLSIQGKISTGMKISNNLFTAVLHPHSGALNRVVLHTKPNAPLYNDAETNGSIQWNPDIYSPPKSWTHTSDWVAPHTKSVVGPVVVKTNSWGSLRHYWGVVASVKYSFYPNKPYFIVSTTMRMKKTMQTLALRNGEMVFNRKLLNRVAWYDVLRDTVMTYNLRALPTLTDLEMPADVPWITFYNTKTGIGFAGIQLGYNNSGIEYSPRLFNPYFYVTVGPWVYWARALSETYISANHQQMIPALKGINYSDKWAYIVYKVNRNENYKPYAPILRWVKKLTHPLKVRLVQKVDKRVGKTIHEIMSNGISPWKE